MMAIARPEAMSVLREGRVLSAIFTIQPHLFRDLTVRVVQSKTVAYGTEAGIF